MWLGMLLQAPSHQAPSPVCVGFCCQAELQQREQQLAGVLQSEASNARLQAEHEQQGKTLLKLQQELEQVQQLLQQQSKAAATNKASATAAWWVAASLYAAAACKTLITAASCIL